MAESLVIGALVDLDNLDPECLLGRSSANCRAEPEAAGIVAPLLRELLRGCPIGESAPDWPESRGELRGDAPNDVVDLAPPLERGRFVAPALKRIEGVTA